MKVMILAAGRGKRMRPLTDSIPKPLLSVGDFSLIEHLLFQLAGHGFQDIVINLAHLGDKISARLGNGDRYGVSISYSREDEDQGLETGGGILRALPLLGRTPFLVISGDIWTNYEFSKLRSKKMNGKLAHLILVDNPPEHEQGDFNLLDDQLTESAGKRLTFGNIGIYHPDLFLDCQPGFFPLALVLRKAIAKGRATGEHFQGDWVNVGTPEVLVQLRERAIQAK